ncbi:MAG: NAD(P)H-dependent oxidoreductase [Nitrosomonadales bacterium]
MNILLFPASLRAHSYNRLLLDYLADYLSPACKIDMLDPAEFTFPLFNQDLESSEEVIAEVAGIYHRFNQADGMIIASPEYNGHVSPYLKNTLDWVSRLQRIRNPIFPANPFLNKPLLLTSASTGWTGGLLGLQDARSIMGYLGCLVMQNQLCISNADAVLPAGNFEDSFANYMKQTVQQFQTLVQKNK